jgi:branched-chain amino acid transport system substrate-binding protein
MHRKWFSKLTFGAGVGAAMLAITAQAPAQAADPIKVGVVVPVTSILAAYGTPFVVALQLAVDDANAQGGVEGRKIELVVEDSQASNTVAINALNKVLEEKPVAVFGPALGPQVLAMMPITEREQIPFLAGPSTRRVTQQGAKYFFRTGTHDALDKEVVTRFMVEDLKKTKVGILHVGNEWGYSGRDNVTTFLNELGGLKPVSVASYQPTDKDLTAQILQMKSADADVIFSQGFPVDEALIIKQLNQLNVKVPHIASGTGCISYLRSLVTPDEMVGHYCEEPDVLPTINERPAVKAFVEKYVKVAGFPPDVYPALYYDGMSMLIAVMKKYGIDHENIRKGLAEMSFDGILGTYKADGESNLWHRAVLMKFLPGGKVEVARTLDQKF